MLNELSTHVVQNSELNNGQSQICPFSVTLVIEIERKYFVFHHYLLLSNLEDENIWKARIVSV